MKILNLQKVKRIKRSRIINEYCGGHFGKKEAFALGGVGVGGLHYVDGADLVDGIKKGTTLKANIESLREGFGFYLRETDGNYLLLLKYEDVLSISFYKEKDKLKEKDGFSLFKSCMRRGIPYHYSKLMLLEDEIGEMHQPKVKIVTKDLDEINFVCSRKNPFKIRDYFHNLSMEDKFVEDYSTFTF